MPDGRLSAEALALHDRLGQLRLARMRLRRIRNEVALQVARAFLTLTERTQSVGLLEERLAFAERDLEQTRFRVAQGAADRLALLDATIAATDQHNTLDEQRAALALDTAEFFADLELAPAPLAVPAAADPAALRRSAQALLAEPTPAAAIANALDVLAAEAALSSAELQAERTLHGALPALSVGLDYRKPRGAPRPGSVSLSITGSYTLFDSGRNAAASAQAEEQVTGARRALATARRAAQDEFARARLTLASAVADEQLAVLQLERAGLRMEQATRRHAAGAISDRELEEASLHLRETQGSARARQRWLSRTPTCRWPSTSAWTCNGNWLVSRADSAASRRQPGTERVAPGSLSVGNHDLEARPSTIDRAGTDPPAVRFDDGARHSQPQATARLPLPRFAAEERIEHVLQLVGRDAGTGILDGKLHVAIALQRGEPDAVTAAGIMHSVFHEVVSDARKQAPVRVHHDVAGQIDGGLERTPEQDRVLPVVSGQLVEDHFQAARITLHAPLPGLHAQKLVQIGDPGLQQVRPVAGDAQVALLSAAVAGDAILQRLQVTLDAGQRRAQIV